MPPRRTLVVSVLMTSAWLALGLSADTSAQDRAIPQTVLIFIDDLHIDFAYTPSYAPDSDKPPSDCWCLGVQLRW